VVATGRLASSEPNLQNVPVTGLGLEIREAFVPDKGHIFIAADYSQIELRVLAYLSQDPVLIDAFNHQRDIHIQTAAGIFDVSEQQVTAEQRQVGKKINFSILYGQGAYSLSKELHIPFKQAQQYIDGYFAQYTRVKEWIDSIIAGAKMGGYVSTFWGRRRYIEHINAQNNSLRQEACRIAVNTVVQGTAADVVKCAMINLFEQFHTQHIPGRMILQIHDEIIVTVLTEYKEQAQLLIQHVLQQICPVWNVPLNVTIRTGYSWKEVSK
jgi:DNA polymerase-1